MKKRVLYLVIEKTGKKENEETHNSIKAVLEIGDHQLFIKYKDDECKELYYELKEYVKNVNEYDYVCLVPNGSTVNSSTKKVFNEYELFDVAIAEIFLPFVFTMIDKSPLILNKTMWNSAVASQAGFMDLDLSLKQADYTIFAGMIPTKLFFDENNYNKDLKYYQQYYFLNSIAATDDSIVGIPKIFAVVNDWDFKIEHVTQEEKIKYFTLAREKWLNMPLKQIVETLDGNTKIMING